MSGPADAAAFGAALVGALWFGAVAAAWAGVVVWLGKRSGRQGHDRIALAGLVVTAVVPFGLLATTSVTGQPWMAWLAYAWLAGVGVSVVRFANSLRAVALVRRHATPAPREGQERFSEIARAMGIRRTVTLQESDDIDVPCAIGVWSPVVLLPGGLYGRLRGGELDAIAAHELAHVAARDYAWRLLQHAAEAVAFHHPAAWFLSALVEREREARCDENASAVVGPRLLAETLAALEKSRSGSRDAGRGAGPLLDRVRALARQAELTPPLLRPRVVYSAAVVSVSVAAAGFWWATNGILADAVGAAAVPPLPSLLAVAVGLLVGIRHAFEPDHLMAVATLIAREQSPAAAIRQGASWGLGHTASLVVLGTFLTGARRSMPAEVGAILELAVAILIVGMGARAIVAAWRLGGRGPLQAHAHHSIRHAHPTAADHVHVGPMALARWPLMVGVVHGFAGSGALTALAMSSLPTIPEQVAFVLLFGIGSTLAMAAVAGLVGWPLARVVRGRRALTVLSSATGAAAIVFGIAWGYPLLVELTRR